MIKRLNVQMARDWAHSWDKNDDYIYIIFNIMAAEINKKWIVNEVKTD